jgi:5-methylcytosine-specific restriction endonuclease McrA
MKPKENKIQKKPSSSSYLEKETTLSLNSAWQPCGFKLGHQAICAMMSGDKYNPPALGVHLEYAINEDGSLNFDEVTNITTLKWEDWTKLPVRPHDFKVRTVRGDIRIPTVIIHPKFNKKIRKRKHYSKNNVFERDGYVCQYTNQPLTRSTITLDHVVPLSKGGKSDWTNTVACHIDINNKKGNKLNHEVGLSLIKKPVAPPEEDLFHKAIVNKHSIRITDWNYFLKS